MTPGPAEPLADLAAALDGIGVRWYVFGAHAALVWGRPRLTTDVDVTVQCTLPTRELVGALEAHGFALRVDGTQAFIDATRVVPLEHRASGLALDVVLAGPGLEELFLETSWSAGAGLSGRRPRRAHAAPVTRRVAAMMRRCASLSCPSSSRSR